MGKMKKGLIAAALCVFGLTPVAWAADAPQNMAAAKPACVLMEFTNDTRFKDLQPEKVLSELVMEKLLASGKFNLKETKPLAQETKNLLYDENARLIEGMQDAMNEDDFTALFKMGMDDQKQALSISSASEGQIISPVITSQIGAAHHADYLLQGRVFAIGHLSQLNQSTELAKSAVGTIGGLVGGIGTLFHSIAGSVENKETGVVMTSDIRLIRASTGEVVWSKAVLSKYKQDKVSAVGITTGSDSLHMDLVAKALDQAAQKIVDELVADVNKGKLFVK